MTEIKTSDPSRILSEKQKHQLSVEIFSEIDGKPWRDAAYTDLLGIKTLIKNGIGIIEQLEEATHQKHPQIHSDTDVVYIDSGPGPYSYNMLEPNQTDLEDFQYHKWLWSRKMDRARIRTAYVIAGQVTAKRIQEKKGETVDPKDLTEEDFAQYGPTLMYTSTSWQAKHIRNAMTLSRGLGTFKIPDSKILMYEEFINSEGQVKPIVNTRDQIEGLRFPANPDGSPPKRVVMVSHPAHLLRIMHILGMYADAIPDETVLQIFPIPTPLDAVEEYTKAEILGALTAIYQEGRATLKPFTNYEL